MPDTLFTTHAPSSNGTSVQTAGRVIKNDFGDGYRQTAPDGLNPAADTYTLAWTALPIADADAIRAFLKAHVGLPFFYQMPRETTARLWDCNQWTRSFPAGGYDSLSAVFVERFDFS